MALPPADSTSTRIARDEFERHFAEKIWDLIPEMYRHEDGVSATPGQLRSLVEILATQAAHQRRSTDRLLADSRILEADDWAIAYIGDLLGTRMLDPRNSAGRRADVGRTLAYRRRAGTAGLLEMLANDIADWDATAHEAFAHLFRYPHKWERHFERGEMTGTPRGGYPDMRSLRIGDTSHGPFEDAAHRPAIRSAGRGGPFYNIPDVTLHCFRKYAFRLAGVTPRHIGVETSGGNTGLYTIDPSGRGHVPLYQPGTHEEGECAPMYEWRVRQAITCRRLGHVRYALPEGAQLIDSDFAPLTGRVFHSARELVAAAADAGITDAAALADLLDLSLDKDSAKARLFAEDGVPAVALRIAVDGAPPRLELVTPAGLSEWADGIPASADIPLMIDPAGGLVKIQPDAELDIQLIHTGAYGLIGAGGYDRDGRIPDPSSPAPPELDPSSTAFAPLSGERIAGTSATYVLQPAGDTINITDHGHLDAANGARPYLSFQPSGSSVTIQPVISASAPSGSHRLELSGLWIGIEPDGGGDRAELRISGNWSRVVLRDMTLDPGGMRMALPAGSESPIAHVELVIDGVIDELVIDNCILGTVRQEGDALSGELPCVAGSITLCDSIIQGLGDPHALDLLGSDVTMDRCTVLGNSRFGQTETSDSILDGLLDVQDAQGSCLRFSMAASGGRIPAPYESLILPGGLPRGSFESRRFGDPGYCVLTPCAPEAVRMAAEGGLEMGAFNRELFPIKKSDLLAKLAEFAPAQARVHLVMES